MSIYLPGGIKHYKEEIFDLDDSSFEHFCKLLEGRKWKYRF